MQFNIQKLRNTGIIKVNKFFRLKRIRNFQENFVKAIERSKQTISINV